MQTPIFLESAHDELMAALAGMSGFLGEAFGSLTPERARVPGPEGAFSPVEHAWHLADVEREAFALRIRSLMEERNPHLADFDGARIAEERNYRARSLAEGLSAFAAARQANLAVLRGLSPEAWTRGGTQEGVGPVSLRDIPRLMRQHDESHVAEIRAWQKHIARLGREY